MAGASSPAGRRASWARWSTLSQVGRVEAYTLWSLVGIMVLANASVVVGVAVEQPVGTAIGLLVGGVAVTAAGSATLVAVFDRYPAIRPLPLRRIAVFAAVGAIYVLVATLAWSPPLRGVAVISTGMAASVAFGLIPDNRAAMTLIIGGGVVAGLHHPHAGTVGAGLFVATAYVLTGRASMWLLSIVRELDAARSAQSELAVMEERLRFSRDVHDVMGRRLSTIAVQAELAATLAQRGDERAPDRMLEVREVAHQALREARELARGYRTTNFDQEVEGARSLLRSAGIEVRLGIDEALPHAWHEAAGWVVREAVTNVLRHSDATLTEITFSAGRLVVANDGIRPGRGEDGAGLRGLRERLVPLGAAFTAGPDGGAAGSDAAGSDGGEGGDGSRWTVVAELPGAGPLSSARDRGARA